MTALPFIRCFVTALVALLASTGAIAADPAASPLPRNCAAPSPLSAIEAAQDRTASRILSGRPLTIVAVGSSSTVGVGASDPILNYPSRLQQELRERFPGIGIRVINHGVSGQDVPEELARLGRDVIAESPDLVIWQVGTNAVLRRDDLVSDELLITRGVASMKEKGIDVVLMDLQYAPRVLARPASAEMERLIAEVSKRMQVGLFRRFEIMREWERTQQLAPASAIGADGLHMTDASYVCLAHELAEALTSNWRSLEKLAKSSRRSPDAIAGIGSSEAAQPVIPLQPH
jgi:acyl-CoA thioesterase-1